MKNVREHVSVCVRERQVLLEEPVRCSETHLRAWIKNNYFLTHFFQRRTVRLTPEQAAELYRGHYGKHHFPHLVAHISSGPIIAMVLAAKNAITKWRTLMGPARYLLVPCKIKSIVLPCRTALWPR